MKTTEDRMKEIEVHFENITPEQFETNLINAGIEVIEPVEEPFETVIEPESSTSQLIAFENKYRLNTSSFIDCYAQRVLRDEKDFDLWYYQYSIFVISGGDESKINKW